MPMFESDEEFEAYVAQQQAELAGEEQNAAPPPPRAKGPLEQGTMVLTALVPIALAVVIGVFVWNNAPDPSKRSHDSWDNILGMTAWATGRVYNADANNLTERLRLRHPGDTRGQQQQYSK